MDQSRTGSGGTGGLGGLLQLLLSPACPGRLTIDIIDGDVGTFWHDTWADRRLVQLGGADISSESCREEPTEDASHDETDHDQTEDDD